MRKEIGMAVFLATVDWLFYVYAEPYVPSKYLRFLMIGVVDVLAIKYLKPYVNPLLNRIFSFI